MLICEISNVSSFTASDQQFTNCGTPTLTNDTHPISEMSFDMIEKDFNEQPQDFLTSGWLLEDTTQFSEHSREQGTPMTDSIPARSQMDKDDNGPSPFAIVQQREEYLQNLSSLSEALLKRLYAIDAEDSLDYSSLIPSTATTASVPLQCFQKSPMISIGQLLKDSQQLLDLLQPFLSSSLSLAEYAMDVFCHPTLTAKTTSSIPNAANQSTETFGAFDSISAHKITNSVSTHNSSLPDHVEATHTPTGADRCSNPAATERPYSYDSDVLLRLPNADLPPHLYSPRVRVNA